MEREVLHNAVSWAYLNDMAPFERLFAVGKEHVLQGATEPQRDVVVHAFDALQIFDAERAGLWWDTLLQGTGTACDDFVFAVNLAVCVGSEDHDLVDLARAGWILKCTKKNTRVDFTPIHLQMFAPNMFTSQRAKFYANISKALKSTKPQIGFAQCALYAVSQKDGRTAWEYITAEEIPQIMWMAILMVGVTSLFKWKTAQEDDVVPRIVTETLMRRASLFVAPTTENLIARKIAMERQTAEMTVRDVCSVLVHHDGALEALKMLGYTAGDVEPAQLLSVRVFPELAEYQSLFLARLWHVLPREEGDWRSNYTTFLRECDPIAEEEPVAFENFLLYLEGVYVFPAKWTSETTFEICNSDLLRRVLFWWTDTISDDEWRYEIQSWGFTLVGKGNLAHKHGMFTASDRETSITGIRESGKAFVPWSTAGLIDL